MERSKALILIVVALAAALIVWQLGFSEKDDTTTSEKQESSETQDKGTQTAALENNTERNTDRPERFSANSQRRETTEAIPNNENLEQADRQANAQQAETQTTDLKIAIPKDISKEQLQIIYAEYRQFAGGRTGRSRGFGGDMPFPDFGNMEGMPFPDFGNMEGMPFPDFGNMEGMPFPDFGNMEGMPDFGNMENMPDFMREMMQRGGGFGGFDDQRNSRNDNNDSGNNR